MLRNVIVVGLSGLLGCAGGRWDGAEPTPTPDSGSPLAQRPDGGMAPKDLVWLSAGAEHSFPTYILWGSTRWRVTNVSTESVPFEAHCRARSRHYTTTLEPGHSAEYAWQCQGDPLRVKNLGLKNGGHILEVYTQ